MAPSDFASPMAVFRAAVDAAHRQAWRDAAGYCDPISLRSFQREQLEWFFPSTPRHRMTVDEYLEHQPNLPRAVAEYYVAQSDAEAASDSSVAEDFAGIESVDQLRELDPVSLYAKWLEGQTPDYKLTRWAAAGKIAPTISSAVRKAPHVPSTFVVVGIVHDGDHLAHVLYREEVAPSLNEAREERQLRELPPEDRAPLREVWERLDVSLTMCRRQPDDTWRLWADRSFPGLVGLVAVSEDAPGD